MFLDHLHFKKWKLIFKYFSTSIHTNLGALLEKKPKIWQKFVIFPVSEIMSEISYFLTKH